MIVGFCGYARSGKDTAADYLVEHHGFKKVGFADVLKNAVGMVFDFSEEQLYGDLKEVPDLRYEFTGTCMRCHEPCTPLTELLKAPETDVQRPTWYCQICEIVYPSHVTPRLALQTGGTEWGRTLFDKIWVHSALNYIQKQDPDQDWVFRDVRFRNEMEGIQDRGGVVARLLRGECRFNHPSEVELSEIPLSAFDGVLDNRGTLEEFYILLEKELPKLRAMTAP